MRFLEAINRILVGMLLSLVLLQAGLLFFMKNMEDQAQYRLVQNTSQVDVMCGENSFSENPYWSLNEQATSQSSCEGSDCLFSHISWSRAEQTKDLQVIAVQSAPPFRWGQMNEGGVVRVRVKATEKPQVLALVSRQRLEWSFQVDKGAKIEKVIVATPQVVWLQGLPPKTEIEYLPKEKMCSYPYAWEEAFNPDNEFRVLSLVLKKITGLDVTTFQGALIGKEFRLPMFDKVRGLASLEGSGAEHQRQDTIVAIPSLPTLTWARQEAHVVPQKMIFNSQEIIFPAKTQHVQAVGDQLFILKSYLLWRWDQDKKDFVRMHLPQSLPHAQYMKAVTVSASHKVLFVYNDERGGEMYRFDIANNQWSLLHAGYAFNVEALYFDEQAQSLRAVSSRGPHLTQFLKMDAKAKVQEVLPLKTKISFDKKHWKWQLEKQQDLYLMRLHQAVRPEGQIVALEF